MLHSNFAQTIPIVRGSCKSFPFCCSWRLGSQVVKNSRESWDFVNLFCHLHHNLKRKKELRKQINHSISAQQKLVSLAQQTTASKHLLKTGLAIYIHKLENFREEKIPSIAFNDKLNQKNIFFDE